MPYRAIVAVKLHSPSGPALYQVAGLESSPRGAINALKLALGKHGGTCFYCKKQVATETSVSSTLDHLEPMASGGKKNDLANLVVACKPCNVAKGQGLIDSFNPYATHEWLSALRAQIDARLKRLATATPPPSQPQPTPAAASGP